jgi:hypothetical protein
MGFSLSHAATVSYDVELYLVIRSPTSSTWSFRKGHARPPTKVLGSNFITHDNRARSYYRSSHSPNIQSQHPPLPFLLLPYGWVETCQQRTAKVAKPGCDIGLTCRNGVP